MAKSFLTAVGALGFLVGVVFLVVVRGSWQYALMIILIGSVATTGVAVIDAIESGIARRLPEKSEPVVAAQPLPVTPGIDVVEAKLLLKRAEDLQFARDFGEAAAVYESVLAGFPESLQAAAARRQLENLRHVS
jgi:hypothetical protein